MTANFSVDLEIIRVFATFLVFIGHTSSLYTPLSNVRPGIGRQGVIFFFILSGYVISWCAKEKERTLVQFITNRAARIYSVALPAIMLSFIVSIILFLTHEGNLPYQLKKLLVYIPIYLSFTGDFWTLSETPPNDFPYWSLDYEVWYYVLFGIFFYLKGRWRILFITFLVLAIGPYIISMFPLWLFGSLIYFSGRRLRISKRTAKSLFFISAISYLYITFFNIDVYLNKYNVLFNIYKIHWTPKNFLGDYLIGLVVVVNFICARKADFEFKKSISFIIRKIASYSFSCYLFHIPILALVMTFIGKSNSIVIFLTEISIIILSVIFLAKFTEHKKTLYRSFINNTFTHIKLNWPSIKRQ